MDPVKLQYETYPYPARNPADEKSRLIEGSPSHPLEIDHFLFAGRRDWSAPFRALVAGGGTGDALIMLAQKLADMNAQAEIVYLDISKASRETAEARAKIRGLEKTIRFVTGDLLTAPEFGPFDYIDCCGVLHHLPEPDAGFRALRDALAPEGGIGLMVYAPLGRSGVYPLQEAFRTLLADDAPEDRVALAREALERLSPAHPFVRNPLLNDHRDGDAGVYDLLLHGRDRPYEVEELAGALDQAGLGLVSFLQQGRYDPARWLPRSDSFRERIDRMAPMERAALAERMAGNMKTHIAYAVLKGREEAAKAAMTATSNDPEAVPHLRGGEGLTAGLLARSVRVKGGVTATVDGVKHRLRLPRNTAPAIAQIDGRKTLSQISRNAGMDWISFLQEWTPASEELVGFNLLNYSTAQL